MVRRCLLAVATFVLLTGTASASTNYLQLSGNRAFGAFDFVMSFFNAPWTLELQIDTGAVDNPEDDSNAVFEHPVVGAALRIDTWWYELELAGGTGILGMSRTPSTTGSSRIRFPGRFLSVPGTPNSSPGSARCSRR